MNLAIALTGCVGMAVAAATIHHESLEFVARAFLARVASRPRRWHVGATMAMLLVAHVIEVVAYGAGMCMIARSTASVGLAGGAPGESLDSLATWIYFSFSCYTSLGIGDLRPVGGVRLFAGTEALVGLLLIGWTASFILLEMRRLWPLDDHRARAADRAGRAGTRRRP